jgi:alpha-beta hydrolase superfamily lysophospholipase
VRKSRLGIDRTRHPGETMQTSTSARLVPTRTPRAPRAAVVVLHGGAARPGRPRVSPAQLSVVRMVPIAARLAATGRGELAVFRLLNSSRGWDTGHTPVDDARWALEQVAARYGELPTGLVGHSLGGRAALLAAPSPGVRTVVALNPWLDPRDRADLHARDVLVVHGTDDRVASPERAEHVARSISGTAATFGFLRVEGGKHAMLRRSGVFTRAATDFVVATLLGRTVDGPVGQVLRGERDLEV